MYRRNLIVVFKPSKNNALQLPATFFNMIHQYQERGCIRLTYMQNKRDHYMAWAPQAGNLRDTEIGINSIVAKALGLKEGAIVTCSLVEDAPSLRSINIVTYAKKDWDMLEASSYRLQATMLDQTQVVTKDQQLVVWINAAMTLVVNVRRLSPDVPYGRLCEDTQVHVTPFDAAGGPSANGNAQPATTVSRPPPSTAVQPADPLPATNGHNGRNALRTSASMASVGASQRNGNGIAPTALAPLERSASTVYRPLANDHHRLSTSKLEQDLRRHIADDHWFRIVPGAWESDGAQLFDAYTNAHNMPDALDAGRVLELNATDADGSAVRCYLNVRVLSEREAFPRNAYRTLELSAPLLRSLGVDPLRRVRCVPRDRTVTRNLERIELLAERRSDATLACDLEFDFKRWVSQRLTESADTAVLLNQNECVRLAEGRFVTVRLVPEHMAYACVDATLMRACRVMCVEETAKAPNGSPDGDEDAFVGSAAPKGLQRIAGGESKPPVAGGRGEQVRLEKFDAMVERLVGLLVSVMSLDCGERVGEADQRFNLVISGKAKSGKTQIAKRILQALAVRPYFCFAGILDCTQYKGRKPESIERDLRETFDFAIDRMPAIVVLDNLDVLTPPSAEHTQDADYANRVADIVRKLIEQYSAQRTLCVVATCSNARALNKRLQQARGSYTFHDLSAETPCLERVDREQVLRQLTSAVADEHSVNYAKIAGQTEGYGIGDLVELARRAVYFAHKANPDRPQLNGEHLLASLKVTNAYCLQGIENGADADAATDGRPGNATDDDDEDSIPNNRVASPKLAGLGNVTRVLEEVLIWPVKYQAIFARSPLRNQAGVLLFGAPGTGKTYAVGRLARLWRLRLISVKGPELLAKYIGQSEENVRNVFDRARKAKPCVLFFDEFDSLAPKRGHDSTGVTDRVVNQLLTELDGVQGLDGVVVIAATSRPDLLDGALLRSGRIDRMVELPLPDRSARGEILDELGRTLHFAGDVNLQALVNQTDRYTGADLQSLLTSANMAAVQQCLQSNPDQPPEKVVIHQQHLLEARKSTRPSLAVADLEKYKHIYKRFSSAKGTQPSTQDFVTQRATLA